MKIKSSRSVIASAVFAGSIVLAGCSSAPLATYASPDEMADALAESSATCDKERDRNPKVEAKDNYWVMECRDFQFGLRILLKTRISLPRWVAWREPGESLRKSMKA